MDIAGPVRSVTPAQGTAFAAMAVLSGIQPDQVPAAMTHALIQGLAMVGQFVCPLLCLMAAAVSNLSTMKPGGRLRRDRWRRKLEGIEHFDREVDEGAHAGQASRAHRIEQVDGNHVGRLPVV